MERQRVPQAPLASPPPAPLPLHPAHPAPLFHPNTRPLLLQPTLDVLHSLGAAERLAPLARSGALLVVRPGDWVEALSCGRVPEGFPPEATAMYEQLTRRRPAQRHGEEGGGAEEEEQQQQPAAADAAANAAAAAAATWALSSGDVAACVRAGAHGTVFVLGTSHLSKKSADEVEEAVRVSPVARGGMGRGGTQRGGPPRSMRLRPRPGLQPHSRQQASKL